MYKQFYQHFLQARPELLHCAPHSHYYWPDVTRAAHLQYWDDSARFADEKWGYLFSEKIPRLQQYIADELNLTQPEQIVFAPNTHEFVYRIISVFPAGTPLKILTTDGEFHSFNRQSRRLEERGNIDITRVPCEPFDTFAERWHTAVSAGEWDLIFISQVFYNSGIVAPAPSVWLDAVANPKTVIVVDGYHGFCALPTDWSSYANRVFYLAGGYKYAQGGEGMCFAVVPTACQLRPEYTGWFADFAGLAKAQTGPVAYANDGMRFAGATMDFSAAYRMLAVFELWQQAGLTTAARAEYISHLQGGFLQHIASLNHPLLNEDNRLHASDANAQHGHFFTYRLDTAEQVSALAAQLSERGVATDYRHDRLRFGFALYHEVNDYRTKIIL